MLKRSEARNNAFLLLFEASFSADTDRKELLSFAEECHDIRTDAFVLQLFHGVLDHLEEIDDDLRPRCVRRTLDRLSRALLTALRIAVYELKYTETDFEIVANEAVSLIKAYDSPEAAAYGNGVLASYVRGK